MMFVVQVILKYLGKKEVDKNGFYDYVVCMMRNEISYLIYKSVFFGFFQMLVNY